MFVDKVDIFVASGKGGAGAVSFRREKFVIQGGPDGGNGGKGGNVYFYVSANCDTLSNFRGKKHYKAKNGAPGGPKKMAGKSGEDIIITVPPGTQVMDFESGELFLDLKEVGSKVLFLEGGKGGLGNFHFKSATNQTPTYAQKGVAGEEKHIYLELKLIADVGLVGFPNVGKSTLVSMLSNATPEIANYEFTTLIPSLGVVEAGAYRSFVMADIPGIIEGASEGKGLGLAFLRHIERTSMVLYVIDICSYRSMKEQLFTLIEELKSFSEALAQKPYGIILSRVDSVEETMLEEQIQAFMDLLGLKPNVCPRYHLVTPAYFGSSFFEVWEEQIAAYTSSHMQAFSQKLEFILPVSSLAHIHTEPLKFILQEVLVRNGKGSTHMEQDPCN